MAASHLNPTAADVLAYEQAVVNGEEAKQTILKSMQLELDKHRMREVLDIFNNNVLAEVAKHGSFIVWDLVPIICQRLRGLNEFRFKTFNCCRQMLIDLVEVCNPKELLIIYLSELENDLTMAKQGITTATTNSSNSPASSPGKEDEVAQAEDLEAAAEDKVNGDFEVTDSNCFKALLKPFECILLKLPKKRNETLKSVLSSLNEHISRLSLSVIEQYDFELQDRFRLMCEPEVKNLNCVLSMYVDFLETFVSEVDITQGDANYFYSKTSVPNIQRCILLKTLLRILDYPLKYMDLTDLTATSSATKTTTTTATTTSGAKSVGPCSHHQQSTKLNGDHSTTTTTTTTKFRSNYDPPAKTTKAATSKTTTTNTTTPTTTKITTNGLIMPSVLDDECIITRSIALKVVRLISVLHSNFYTLLTRHDLITPAEVIASAGSEFSDIYLSPDIFRSAMSVLCYLLATEQDSLAHSNFMPRVYTHVYSLGVHLPYVRHLLDSSQFLVYDKGVDLLQALLEQIAEESLEVKFLDLLRAMPVEKSLISIMIFSPIKSRRTAALALFQRLVAGLEHIGRYKMLYSILSQPRQHAGFQGLAIGMYKDMMFSSPVYQGTNLHRVVRSVISICLPEEVSSDLLEKNDLIFAALNFFRYVCIRDPKAANATRIWDILVVINESFLGPLHKAVELSRAHYKLELCKLKELREITTKGGKGSGINAGDKKALRKVLKQMAEKSLQTSSLQAKLAVKVLNEGGGGGGKGGGGKGAATGAGAAMAGLPEMSIEQEHNVIILALQNFDLLESLLARLKELVEQSGSSSSSSATTTTTAAAPGGQ